MICGESLRSSGCRPALVAFRLRSPAGGHGGAGVYLYREGRRERSPFPPGARKGRSDEDGKGPDMKGQDRGGKVGDQMEADRPIVAL